jgi:hypothetical protein
MVMSKMDLNLKLNADEYDEQQVILIGSIIEDVKARLEEDGIKGEQLKKLVSNISFGIATLIDNSASIEFEGKEIFPQLTFYLEDEDNLIHCDGNSYMHEYVFGIVDEIFEKKP